VDSTDRRARSRLLARGIRYFSKMQAVVYAAHMVLKPSLYIDVGVNYGETLFAKPLFDRTETVGYEANPGLIPHIEKSRIYNDDVEVTLVPMAVGDRTGGDLTFYVNDLYSGNSSAAKLENKKGVREITVPVTTLDADILPRGCDLERVLIKIDVEGYEPQALKGATELLRTAHNAVVLIEFDSDFMPAAGVDPKAFFAGLAEVFDILFLDYGQAHKVTAFTDLPQKGGRVHADLALMKFADPALRDLFIDRFCNGSLKDYTRGCLSAEQVREAQLLSTAPAL
jgi:FkbM family methyltransferase